MADQVSIRQQLLDVLCAKLPDDGTLIKKVYRSMTQAVQADNLPVCAVFPVNEVIDRVEHDGVHRLLTLHIVYVLAKEDGDDSASLDQLIDLALVWIENKVVEDPELGGLGLDSRVAQITWQFESGEFGFVGAVVEAQIEYNTLVDPSVSNQ